MKRISLYQITKILIIESPLKNHAANAVTFKPAAGKTVRNYLI